MMSQQQISDRFEIQDLCYRYAEIIDGRDFDALRTEIFTADAYIDYSVFGGSAGGLEETIAFLKDALTPARFSSYYHLNANIQVVLDGDCARGRVMCFNPQEMVIGEAKQLFMLGLWYLDEYRRTPAGWRMCKRVEEKSWVFNTPEFMNL